MKKTPVVRSAFSGLHLAVLVVNAGLIGGYSTGAMAAPANQALEEVVVTARKREESVQDVPIAMTAFSSKQLEDAGISQLQGLSSQVPGLSMDTGGNSQIWIRGIGQRATASLVDGPVGVYLDGVYIARKQGQMLDLMDTESIQVLRGPQGTLFGKNTTGGALVITSRKPTNEFGGRIETRLGDYNRQDVRGTVNLPIIEDKLLSRITVGTVRRDGFQENAVTGAKANSEDRQAGSLQLRWLASDTVTVDAFATAVKTREVPPVWIASLPRNSSYKGSDALFHNYMWPGDTTPVWPLEGAFGPAPAGWREISQAYEDAYARASALPKDKFYSNAPRAGNNIDNYLAGVTVEWDINELLSFKSITGYGKQYLKAYNDYGDGDGTDRIFTGTFNYATSPRQQLSQEFQLTGEAFDERLHYTTGIFGMVEDIKDNIYSGNELRGFALPNFILGLPGNPLDPAGISIPSFASSSYRDNYKLKNTTLAAFAQGSYDITDNFQATVGLRWTSEKRESTYIRQSVDMDAINNTVMAAGIPGVMLTSNGLFIPAAVLGLDPMGQMQALFPVNADGTIAYPYTAPHRYPDASKTWNKVSPMFSLSYKLPDNWLGDSFIDSTMVYFTHSEGFKSGSFALLGNGLRTIDPETVKSNEIGIKLDAFDRTLRFNMAVYDMKYDDQQLLQVQTDPVAGSPTIAYANASKSNIRGVEAEFNWQPLPGLLINAGGNYNNYSFKKFMDKQFLTSALILQQDLPEVNRTSERFPEVPDWTANFGIQYTFDIGIGTLTPRLQYSHTSDVYLGLDPGAWGINRKLTVPGFDLFDARLTFSSMDERFGLALYVDNLTDERYYQGAVGVGDAVGQFERVPSPPRMWGLEMSYKFGAL